MLTSRYDQIQSAHRKEPSEQELFNEVADADLHMWMWFQWRTYSKQNKIHLLYQNLQVMIPEDLGVTVPMDDPDCQLTADARAVQQIYKMAWAKADEYERKGEAA